MSAPVISVRGLGKRYTIGHASHDTLRDHIAHGFKSLFRHDGDSNAKAEQDETTFWALKDVSFDVIKGEIVGVIGRNGAGKSTLLKILSQITEPTEGEVRINGRVASLLEVGTGFHPELTGRENIFLNGAILGMTKSEIRKKFNEIVAFAEVEKFLDTPVKRYSSGMYVRLAFAVAAHLEPEILIVDEVLAVGDAQFQQKCMGKMGDVAAREGRTVLFVSHNMVAVQSLCLRTVWLSQGQMLATGQTDQIVSEYLKLGSSTPAEQVWNDPTTAPGNDQIRFHALRVRARDGSRPDAFTMRTPLAIEIAFWNLVAETDLAITLHVFTQQGVVAFGTSSAEWTHDWSNRRFPKGCFRVTCNIPGDLLNSGTHQVKLLVVRDQTVIIYQKDEAISFQIHDPPESRGAWYGKRVGAVRPKLEWKAELC